MMLPLKVVWLTRISLAAVLKMPGYGAGDLHGRVPPDGKQPGGSASYPIAPRLLDTLTREA